MKEIKENAMAKRKNRAKKIIITAVVLIALLAAAFYIYTLDYYRAEEGTADKYSSVEYKSENLDNAYVFYPESETDKNIGLMFYPGGKVEAIAYAPLLDKISQSGVTCVILEMPFNLAVFDIKAADKVYDAFPEIDSWFLMGHSLGGAMSSSYAGDNYAKLEGLILLGAYPINDADISTIAIYGSEDMGLDAEKLETAQTQYEISGGNHAYFGNYGEQKGDGTASITRESQQEQAVEQIMLFIENTLS